jgi:mRNA-degrading endonuclease RelE of RelBE toxin-antitoxin system
MASDDSLSRREMASIRASSLAIEHDGVDFVTLDVAVKLVERYCESEAPASPAKESRPISNIAVPTEQEAVYWLKGLAEHEVTESPTTELPDWLKELRDEGVEWYVGMSDDFIKSIQRIDKKLMGRILEAMTYICKAPITPRGDTIRPLSSELKGLWRYRIGDFRLVYQPEVTKKRVTLLLFDNRGTVYQ